MHHSACRAATGSRYYLPLSLGFLLGLAPTLSAQSTHPVRLTAASRVGLAFPHVAVGADSTYRGEVQESWQVELGFGIARRIALGVEAVFTRHPGFAADSRRLPSPVHTAFSGVINWAPGGGDTRPGILLSAGAGLYRVHGDFGPAKSTELGFHGETELPLIRLGRTVWLSPGLRGDVVLGVPSSGMYVITFRLGLRYWGL